MVTAPARADESQSLAALRALDVLDTEPEAAFDAIVRAAALICGVPISLISLVDTNRQWFKANVGLPGIGETPRDVAFCAHAVLGDAVFEVPDAEADPRFAGNPLVSGSPDIRFYAGAPLRLSDGSHVGTLCVIDRRTRVLDAVQREVLQLLAHAASQALEGRLAVRMRVESAEAAARALDRMVTSEGRFRALSESSPLGIYATDDAGSCTYANARWQEIFGLTQEESRGPGWTVGIHPEDRSAVFAEWQRAVAAEVEFDMQFRVRHPDGTVRFVRSRARGVNGAAGSVVAFVGSLEDVTDRRRIESELARQAELLRVTLNSIGDAVITTDAAGAVLWLNPAAERLTGWPSDEAQGHPVLEVFALLDAETRMPAPDPVAACLAAGGPAAKAQTTALVARDGTERGIEESVAPILSDEGLVLGAVVVFHDVTERRRLSAEVHHRATHDALTGLINRAEFEAHLLQTLAQAHEDGAAHALLAIDLDQFKPVNDACGHAAGDLLLQQVSKLLSTTVRAHDTVARLGGDEFAIILEHCTVAQGQGVAQKICDRMGDHQFLHEGRHFRVGASIGVVPLDNRWASAAPILQAADTACYAAKEAGRNRVHVWLDDEAGARTRRGNVQWHARIEHALDHGGFALYAQEVRPLAAASGGRRAEAFLRLIDADGTLVAPRAFLPAAERARLGPRVDRWVTEQVIRWLGALPSLEAVESIGVNLCSQSMTDPPFQTWLAEALQAAGPAVSTRIFLEIGESAAVANLADVAPFVAAVRTLGARVALDDFGAGPAAFAYLETMPVDAFKIDGSFTRALATSPLQAAAIRCFVDVARIVGVETVAKLVEDQPTLDQLRALGVDHAQGFLIQRPIRLDRLLASTRA